MVFPQRKESGFSRFGYMFNVFHLLARIYFVSIVDVILSHQALGTGLPASFATLTITFMDCPPVLCLVPKRHENGFGVKLW
jgi:hypothetical protein